MSTTLVGSCDQSIQIEVRCRSSRGRQGEQNHETTEEEIMTLSIKSSWLKQKPWFNPRKQRHLVAMPPFLCFVHPVLWVATLAQNGPFSAWASAACPYFWPLETWGLNLGRMVKLPLGLKPTSHENAADLGRWPGESHFENENHQWWLKNDWGN